LEKLSVFGHKCLLSRHVITNNSRDISKRGAYSYDIFWELRTVYRMLNVVLVLCFPLNNKVDVKPKSL
jgi:hypothetical protein